VEGSEIHAMDGIEDEIAVNAALTIDRGHWSIYAALSIVSFDGQNI
jgi:hypothetical protein